ncbi:hypothetical protein K1T71_005919 [Dendrolimus kikuchii]|uniref:Uncharacterized protein n=1 Tax=Dendrolimus kikuchii TaxID=765133 RepID=A0ACC1D2C2_9NEOP|nr:hypothetical protein K1T71_005919 [Dendrolimus kikuchii]
MNPRVQTVLGDEVPESLGITLTHEHLGMEFSHFYRKPPTHIAEKFNKFAMDKLGYIRQYPYSCHNNLLLNDKPARDAVEEDLCEFSSLDGGAIVENTTHGLGRDVTLYKTLSKETGVHIIAGTGYYIEDTQPSDNMYKTVEDLYNHMRCELTVGCDENTNVTAGFMGELASVWPIRDFERKVIKAAGELQKEIGCGVSFHPHRDAEAPFEIVRLYLEAGGTASKAVMSHLDRTLKGDKLLEFAGLGTYCQFDLFGTEVSYYQLNPSFDMPSDAQRIELMKSLLLEGKVDRLLMSHDIHTKHRLVQYGGHGYSHIITNIIPKMKHKGFSQDDIDKITKHNPATWLTIDK